MNAARFLMVVGAIVIGAMVLVIIAARMANSDRLSRSEKRELNRLRHLVDNLDQLAYSHRELDSALAVQVIDEIRRTRRMLG